MDFLKLMTRFVCQMLLFTIKKKQTTHKQHKNDCIHVYRITAFYFSFSSSNAHSSGSRSVQRKLIASLWMLKLKQNKQLCTASQRNATQHVSRFLCVIFYSQEYDVIFLYANICNVQCQIAFVCNGIK